MIFFFPDSWRHVCDITWRGPTWCHSLFSSWPSDTWSWPLLYWATCLLLRCSEHFSSVRFIHIVMAPIHAPLCPVCFAVRPLRLMEGRAGSSGGEVREVSTAKHSKSSSWTDCLTRQLMFSQIGNGFHIFVREAREAAAWNSMAGYTVAHMKALSVFRSLRWIYMELSVDPYTTKNHYKKERQRGEKK